MVIGEILWNYGYTCKKIFKKAKVKKKGNLENFSKMNI